MVENRGEEVCNEVTSEMLAAFAIFICFSEGLDTFLPYLQGFSLHAGCPVKSL